MVKRPAKPTKKQVAALRRAAAQRPAGGGAAAVAGADIPIEAVNAYAAASLPGAPVLAAPTAEPTAPASRAQSNLDHAELCPEWEAILNEGGAGAGERGRARSRSR